MAKNVERLQAREAKELIRREKQLGARSNKFYLIYLFMILALIYITDEIASTISIQFQTNIVTEFFVKNIGMEYGAGLSLFSAIGFISYPVTVLIIFYRPLADKFGRKPFLVINTLCMGLGLFIVYLSKDIYITGSNANLLSSELATYLSGRYVLIHVWPLSYREFLYFNSENDSAAAFRKFIEFGGFPGLKDMMENPVQIRSYLEGIYSTVLLKDVIARNRIRDTAVLEKVILYIADNTGNIFSTKRISDFMKSGGRPLSVETIYNDIKYLENALVLHKVPRYDVRGKKILETMEKYYLADQGLLTFLHGYKDTYINGILENIVFIELLRRGYKVFIGKIGDMEIDFAAEKNGEKLYVQVAYLIGSEETKERELRPLKSLLALGDNFPKLILTMDDLPPSNENGIIRKNIREWILEG